jgi:glycosyltransferase involved in cell wall biosynthesis
MKVLHVISGGDTGGAKTSVINLLKALKEIVTVKLVCFIEAEFAEAARENGIDVVILEQSSRLDFSVVSKLTDMIVEDGYDIVNCHGARANYICSKMSHKIKVPFITTIHSDYLHDFDNNIYKKIIFTLLNKSSLKKMDFFITMANQFKMDMLKRGLQEEKIFTAYNGIVTDQKVEGFDKASFLKAYGVVHHSDNFYVGTASRLHPIKGVDVLLRAAKEVKKETGNIKFLIAGGGDKKYKDKYMQYVREEGLTETVFFLGHVVNIEEFYNILNINTITSHSEAVCYALLEGGKYARPSIASRVGGTPELISHNENGMLFKDDDEQELAKHIMTLYKEPEKAKSLGENLKKKVFRDFSNTAMAQRYYEIYKEIEGMKR